MGQGHPGDHEDGGRSDDGPKPPPEKDWDARYRACPGPFGDAPTAWTVMALAHPQLAAAAPRRALCLADGDGRNGTWLATQGLAVTALDLSAEATRQAVARDGAAGVQVTRLCADLRDWVASESWDLVFLTFLQGPPALRQAGLRAGAAALAPGGWLVLEGFAAGPDPGPEALGTVPGGGEPGPGSTPARWQPAELAAWAPRLSPGLAIEECFTGRLRLRDGPRHAGEATVMRALLRRA